MKNRDSRLETGNRKPRVHRGQATVEYLTTYGWALFALIIVISVIFASGILSPSYLVSEECTFGASIPCDLFIFNQAGETGPTNISIRLHNSFPYTINITRVSLEYPNGEPGILLGTGLLIESGSSNTVSALVTPKYETNSVKRFIGNLTYQSCAPEIGYGCSASKHNITGRVTGKVNQ